MNMMKTGLRLMGAIALVTLGGKLVFDMGCQTGVAMSEIVVQRYEAEAKLLFDHGEPSYQNV